MTNSRKYDDFQTAQLQTLMEKKFSTEDAFNFITQGANPNILNKFGKSLLHLLSQNNKKNCHLKAIQKLVRTYKAQVDVLDQEGMTPLQNVINGKFDINQALLLVHLGANPDQLNKDGESLLHILSQNNKNNRNLEAIKRLVKNYKARIDVPNQEGMTPFQNVISGIFNVNQALLLVHLGANPDQLNKDGESLLHILSQNNKNNRNLEAIQRLVKSYKAQVDVLNQKGLTPFQTLINGNFDIDQVLLLVHLGANPDQLNKDGKSLLQCLQQSNKDGCNNKAINDLCKQHNSNFFKKYPNIVFFGQKEIQKKQEMYRKLIKTEDSIYNFNLR